MTQRRRRGKTRLARMDVASVLRCEPAEVEQLDRDAGRGSEYLAGDLDQAIGFRHFTRTGVLAAGRTVDQQNGWSAAVGVTALRVRNRRASRQPVDRKIIIGIGKFVACLAGPWSFATVLIGVPCRTHDLVELGGKRIERRILELIEKALAELGLVEARARHSLARCQLRHRPAPREACTIRGIACVHTTA